ncbi:bifunctional diguanylate cyclase/phosphodiesterase [Pseudomonas sp. MAG002Y]|uniref:putative bifunctional diguanylate cyclase/phosphodiesterase n=1 Tax=Pseudomonas sp. MAG002Y TaxID=2678690 RepID=UPI001C60C5DE|nr:bifunctional diguanylate cyclase/phosphodiesterase [Pseudomonas sp. MAG002Y]MBW5414750.1 EAL domain-containing protein [Pseudomonas sp. MAG002Y]
MIHRLRRFLLLDESRQTPTPDFIWKTSTLRVLALSSIVLVALIFIHCTYQALEAGRPYVLIMEAVFLGAFFSLFAFRSRSYRLSGTVLIFVLYALGLCSLFFVDYKQAKAGILIIYATPLLALIFFNWRVYLVLCVANLLPLYLLLSDTPIPHLFGINLSLSYTRNYLHLLLFMLFNVCIPLAIARLITTLANAQRRQHQLNQALQYSQQLYNEVFSHLGAFLLCRSDGLILKLNDEAAALLGLPARVIESQVYLGNLVRNEQGEPVKLVPDDSLQEWQVQGRTKPRWLNLRISQPTSNQNVLVKLRDITHLHALQSELRNSERLSILDPLVGVLNRSGAIKRLEQAIGQAGSKPLAALTIRLPHLTYINTKYGLDVGDQYLQAFAHHLSRLPRKNLVARLKGATFLVVLTELDSIEIGLDRLHELKSSLPPHLQIDRHLIDVAPDLGTAFYPQDATNALQLIERSSHALKNPHGDTLLPTYDSNLAQRTFERTELLLELRKAIETHALFLHYQPRVDAQGNLHSVEALVRWTDPNGRPVPPDQFVAIAEESGLIHTLDAYVRDMACAQIARWKRDLGTAPLVAVNLSAQEVATEGLAEKFSGCLQRYGLTPHDLEIEITESSLLHENETTLTNLKTLETSGYRLTMDDFGTGYSSLSRLTHLPISSLKIDRSFLADVPGSERQETLIKTLIALARLMDLKVVAEGVETNEQLALLDSLGCDLYQGYLFSRPVDASTLTERYLAPGLLFKE